MKGVHRMTTTLYRFYQSELQKKGLDEFIDKNGKIVLFKEEHQFIQKILSFDSDVQEITDELFQGLTLEIGSHDSHFKKSFIYRFMNRNMNRQTIEAFKLELLYTFLTNQDYINRLYQDSEKYATQMSETIQQNEQVNDGITTSDNRQAFAELPQNNVQIDVDDTIMKSATDNTISRNKQQNNQRTDGTTTGETKNYSLDELFKSNGLLEQVFNEFDIKCFMQVW